MTENTYVEFEGKCYMIDLDKLLETVTKSSATVKDQTKVETWGYVTDEKGNTDFKTIQKEFSETSSDGRETFSTIRYDLVKNLINLIVSPIADENGNVLRITSFDDMFFGQKIAFNTLLNEGIIIEITEE